MTEKEWLGCTNPFAMLEHLRYAGSERKKRLLACALCRRMWHLIIDERSRGAVEAGEGFAEGTVTAEELRQAWDAANDAVEASESPTSEYANHAAAGAAAPFMHAKDTDFDYALGVACDIRSAATKGADALEAQAALVQDIFGDPFHPIIADPSWLTDSVVHLARSIYNDRAFERMPILADALEESGCTSQDLLNHCRQPGVHVRGCWVVDLVLGKT